MNYKLEKFWNTLNSLYCCPPIKWTINLKSFEMKKPSEILKEICGWTINLKSFEIAHHKDEPHIYLNEL